MYEKEKEEKSNNVGVIIDIMEVAEIHWYGILGFNVPLDTV